MQSPPVQYASTTDGFHIAYTVSGQGRPLVFMPAGVSHVQFDWELSSTGPWMRGLAEGFHLIDYDSRGQGLSTRGMPANLSLDDYLRDLVAVVRACGLQHFVLVGIGSFSHVAVRYALAHPEQLDALILVTTSVSMQAWPTALWLQVASQNWELMVRNISPGVGLSAAQREATIEILRQSSTQDDWLASKRAFATSELTSLLPKLVTPTLVIHPRNYVTLPVVEGTKLAAQIPHARFVMIDGVDVFGNFSQGMQAIDEFLASLPGDHGTEGAKRLPSEPLSRREVEVLSRIASGSSNREIADELVISVRTVERHITHIYAKIGARGKADATAFALRHSLA